MHGARRGKIWRLHQRITYRNLTFGIDADNIRVAKTRLERIETDIINNFKRLGVAAEVLNRKIV